MDKYYRQLDRLELYMHYFIIARAGELAYNTYPAMSIEDFYNKPCDPWTGTTKAYEWQWKFKKEKLWESILML